MTAFLSGAVVSAASENPFFVKKYGNPHETLPFDKVKIEHFMPAFEKGFKEQDAEIDKITSNPAAPNFENTIEALEYSGELLHDVSAVFYTLTSNENNDNLMELASKVAVMQADHSNKINLNEKLFERIKAVYDKKETLSLTKEQTKLLDETYQGFVRNGAGLKGEDRQKFSALSIELSSLSEKFDQNSLKATNQYERIVTDKELLKGLPEGILSAASQRARDKGKEGWLFTLSAPSYVPFMKYAENRALREEMYRAYMTRAASGNLDNKSVIADIVNKRRQIVSLLGYKSYAEYALEHRMAKDPQTVYSFLDKLCDAYMPAAKEEFAEVQGFAIGMEGKYIKLEPWDWSYYSEKLKKAKFDVNDEMLRPYFKLENVIDGVFGLATKLYGISFKENKKIPVWNKEVKAWDVYDKDGKYLAVLYTDFYPRKGKQAGAWMSDFNAQYRKNGKDIRPHVSVTMNFTRSTDTKPSLLTLDEVTTFMHEFGHALNGMFSDVTYRSLSGTSVYRDFVELPSQVMENWATEKEFLDSFAKNYETGEKIPAELIDKIKAARNFNVAYACMRQLSFGYLDMAWHSLTSDFKGDPAEFERNAWNKAIILPQPNDCFMSSTFTHLFSGGYAAGYYSYKWAEVLDADAFEWFTADKVFDKAKAESFRDNVLSRGGTEDPMILYKRFRGQEPTIDALLRRDGILHK